MGEEDDDDGRTRDSHGRNRDGNEDVFVEDGYNLNRFPFIGVPGFKVNDLPHNTAHNFFKLFVTDEVFDLMVAEANLCAQLLSMASADGGNHVEWKLVDNAEMERCLGLVLLMGIIWKPKIADYWRVILSLLRCDTPIFRRVIARDRFIAILKCLQFANNALATADDRLSKLNQVQ